MTDPFDAIKGVSIHDAIGVPLPIACKAATPGEYGCLCHRPIGHHGRHRCGCGRWWWQSRRWGRTVQ